ncbi:MAG: hypothetical protein F6J90_37835 [Moorea sp. SIOASIH]|uniref:hypothetical protein n=1 Tax=Moorena sp. SIOASIH TaxID=2607817 RepID=UPI0013B837EB|nr:hypothetical protein [Moorena sp. SIOASIH]NEO41779.1 hypothetical protein [Moorena sp. SIOASIH]
MKLPNQASPVRRLVVQNYSGVQETLEEVASQSNSWELKLKKENDSSSPFKDAEETLEEVSSEGSSTKETPNPIPEPLDQEIQEYPIPESPDQIQEYPSDTGLWTKLCNFFSCIKNPPI